MGKNNLDITLSIPFDSIYKNIDIGRLISANLDFTNNIGSIMKVISNSRIDVSELLRNSYNFNEFNIIGLNIDYISKAMSNIASMIPQSLNEQVKKQIMDINTNFYSAFNNAITNQIQQILRFEELNVFQEKIGYFKEVALNYSHILGNVTVTDFDLDDKTEYLSDSNRIIDDVFPITGGNKNWQQVINDKIKNLKEKNPVYTWLVIYIIINLLINIYHSSVTELITSRFKVSEEEKIRQVIQAEIKDLKKDLVAEIKSSCTSEESKSILSEYRYIDIEEADIRLNSSIKSESIYKLKLGQVVRILYKNNHWSLIEYSDDDENLIRGWINTIYTKRFD